MSHELMITSAPRGVLPGSMGFCTVAMTPQVPSALVQRIESLSGYRHIFPPLDPRAKQNPICFQHLRIQVAGKQFSLLSRICDAGMDYSERSNKFAHHIALQSSERLADGPAAIMLNSRSFQSGWTGEPRELDANRKLSSHSMEPGIARYWRQITGDGGWAGYLAEHYLSKPQEPLYLEYTLGTDVLKLIAEALALLPEDRRWEVTFSTYYQGLPPDVTCHWRGVLVDSPEAKQARSRKANVIAIHPGSNAPVGGHLAKWSRSGILTEKPAEMMSVRDATLPIELIPQGRTRGKDSQLITRQAPEIIAKSSTKEHRNEPDRFRVLPYLIGFLIGILLAGSTGIAVWFATRGDKELEIAETQRRESKEKELFKKLEISQNTIKTLEDQLSKANKESAEKLQVEKDKHKSELNVKQDDISKLSRQKENPKKDASAVPIAKDNKVNEVIANNIINKEGSVIESDTNSVASYFDIDNCKINHGSILGNGPFTNASLKFSNILLIECGYKYKKNNNGFQIDKPTELPSQPLQPLLSVSINDRSEAVLTIHIDDPDAKNQLRKFMNASLVELESPQGASRFVTTIKCELESPRNYAIADTFKAYNDDAPNDYTIPFTVIIYEYSKINSLYASGITNMLMKYKDIEFNISDKSVKTQTENTKYYKYKFSYGIRDIVISKDSIKIKSNIAVNYIGNKLPPVKESSGNRKDDDRVNKQKIEYERNCKDIENDKLKTIRIEPAVLYVKMYGIDVKLWEMKSNSSDPRIVQPKKVMPSGVEKAD